MQLQSEVAPHFHRNGVASSAGGFPDANGFVIGGAGADRPAGSRNVLIVSNTNNTAVTQTATPNLQPYTSVNWIIKF